MRFLFCSFILSFIYTIFVNQKKLWKIEELWNKYYYLLLQDRVYAEIVEVKQPHNVIPAKAGIQNGGIGVIPAKVGIQEVKSIYKNNISIYNPDFHFVQEFNFEKSEKPVHSDEYGEYFGLKYSQVLEKDGKLIYLFDNHNKIIQAFLEYAEIIKVGSKASYRGFDVVHIDAHDDDAVFAKQKPHHLELKNVQKYIQQTRISDFFDFLSGLSLRGVEQKRNIACAELDSVKQSHVRFPEPAYRTGRLVSGFRVYQSDEIPGQARNDRFINKIHRYTKSIDFQEFKKPQNPYILSLDIDIFSPEGDFTDLESKIKIIAQAWRYADAVCIATSPGFIEQDYAHKIIQIFTKA